MNDIKALRIGGVTLENNIILAPMAGVSDLPFRVLCSEQGAGMVCMEMISAKAIYYGNKNTETLLEIHPEESKVSLQLFGSDPVIMSDMGRRIEERPFDILDINMGCPMPKIVNNQEGSALMRNPELVEKIVTQLVKAVKKPVTVKIRKGFDSSSVNAVEIARIAEASGASAVTVHGRTREEYYTGKADWDMIARVKDAVRIPVIGSGDVTDGESAHEMFRQTGCDGLMIGRAARGNPWIFKQILTYLETGRRMPAPALDKMKSDILKHGELQIRHKGEYMGIREMRKHIGWYSAGIPHSARIRKEVNEMETFEDLVKIIDRLFSLTA